MSKSRRMTEADRIEARRILDGLAETPYVDCRPGIRGACRNSNCSKHHPQPDTSSDELESQTTG